MTARSEKITAELERALRSLAAKQGKKRIADNIRPILHANMDRGRIDGFIEGDVGRVPEYVNRVAERYEKLSPLLRKIQVERAPEEWADLFGMMRKWAYNFFLRKNFSADTNTQEIAGECATDAAIALLGAHFPYDTDFDPWAHVIVQNTCRKYLRKAAQSPDAAQQDIDDVSNKLVAVQNSRSQERGDFEAGQSNLLNAIAQLSIARRQVIEALYFKGLKPDEVARLMRKSVGAIYSLRFNALQDLRKILGESRDKLNE